MDINRFTEKAQQALSAAQTKAVRYGHQQIDVEHLLTALLEQERGLATAIFTKADVDPDSLKRRGGQGHQRLPKRGGPVRAPARQDLLTRPPKKPLVHGADAADQHDKDGMST